MISRLGSIFAETFFLALIGLLFTESVCLAVDSKILGWNVCSIQFIDAPVLRLLRVPGTVEYRALVQQGGKKYEVVSKEPSVNLKGIWKGLDLGEFTLILQWVGKDGKIIDSETSTRTKSPDWDGFREGPANWAKAADRGVAFMIDAAENAPSPYREPGVPVWIWSAASWRDKAYGLNYPAIAYPAYILGFLSCVEHGGGRKDEALNLARTVGDWLLKNRQADSGALPLWPYSTIASGKFADSDDFSWALVTKHRSEGPSRTNLLRACWLARSLTDLYKVTGKNEYLDYAIHIADTTMKFQRADGSFPYRVDSKTGNIAEDYTAHAIDFIRLIEALEPYAFDPKRALAAQKALDWTLTYVCGTYHWKADYEDVGASSSPFENLTQWPTLDVIIYLCRHRAEAPDYLPMAKRLNRWVEDQFVVFGTHTRFRAIRVKGPLVFEQYVCWIPMECHTAHWIQALIELHKATRERVYLEKAMAAANAMCVGQLDNGQFSTGPRDCETGRPDPDLDPASSWLLNWYNGNMWACSALYELDYYVKSVK